MKIALIYLGRKGGGPVYSYEIAKQLDKKSDLFVIFSSEVENIQLWKNLFCKKYIVKTYYNFFSFIFSSFNVVKLFGIIKAIKNFSPDIIYCPFFHPWLPFFYFIFPNIPKVFTLHDPILHSGENNYLIYFIQKYLVKKSSSTIILSNIFKNELNKVGISNEKIEVIPHGIFDYYIQNKQKETKIKSDVITLLFFGRIVDYKGLDVLINAYKKIKSQISNVELLIVGNGEAEKYKKLAVGLQDVIFVNEWIPENKVSSYFLQADILICPYKDATQSGSIPIAYAFSLPVIATKTGGLSEQVDNNVTGILIEPNNVDQLVEACIKLIVNKELRKNYGEAGYNKAKIEWNWDKISDKLLVVFNKILKI